MTRLFKIIGLIAAVLIHASGIGQSVNASKFPPYRITILSPEYRSAIKGNIDIKLYAPGMKGIAANCWHQPDAAHPDAFGYDNRFGANIHPDANGYATVHFPADRFPHGPITVLLHAWDGTGRSFRHADTCYLQLYNEGGVSWNEGLKNAPQPPQAKGMHLVFADDFDSMPSISRGGKGAVYNSIKADGTEYGDAISASFGGPYDPFYQTGTYMRIRAQYRPGIVDSMGWHRQYTSGMLTSERTDGTGIAPRFAYFECRMICPNAIGTWPAFWLLTQGSHVGGDTVSNEYDIIEGYGPHPDGYWITPHDWGFGKAYKSHWIAADSIGGRADFAQTFHTYGCKITADTTYYYFDNIMVWSHPTLEVARKEGMQFMINNNLGGGWPVDLSRYNGAADMYVDWVRVYQ